MSVAMSVLAIVATALVSHYLASFIQAFLHRAVGHHPRGGRLFRTHLLDHHARYPGHAATAEAYNDKERDLSVYYLVPVTVLALASYLALPTVVFVTQVLTFAWSYAVHVYLHRHYHLTRSWLDRFAWFQRKRQLHLVHHRDARKNFAVIDFAWDRLWGTYQAPRQRK